jgi:hypothetical protein
VVKVDGQPAGLVAAAIRVYLPTVRWRIALVRLLFWLSPRLTTALAARLVRQGGQHGRHQGEPTRPTTDRRSVAVMKGQRYMVALEFAAPDLTVGSVGKRVSKFESLVPGDWSVRVVKESPEEGVGEVEVLLTAMSPAMALRDVARAVELVSLTAAGMQDKMPDVVRASVARVSETPPQGNSLESPD